MLDRDLHAQTDIGIRVGSYGKLGCSLTLKRAKRIINLES